MKVDPYIIIIALCVMVGLSYFYDKLSHKFKIPSVLFLIGTGIAVNYFFMDNTQFYEDTIFRILELLGIIGLIMIVLEAAVDLELNREKMPIIGLSSFMALAVLLITSVIIALPIMYFLKEPFFTSLVYAIPMSVISSAVVIPSIKNLSHRKQEFLIYESTFSDIIGIMFFNFIVLNEVPGMISLQGVWMIIITVAVSFVLSYLLVFFFSKIKSKVKLFMMMAMLALLYSVAKKLHLSSLLIILIFGIFLNNPKIFFFGNLSQLISFKAVENVTKDFRIIINESAFVVRTFFFVTFGMSIKLKSLMDPNVFGIGLIIILILYTIRYIHYKIFIKKDCFPEIFLAPRGLITILLFYSIPAAYQMKQFSEGILFFVILSTNLIMMIALLRTKNRKEIRAEYNELEIRRELLEEMHDEEESGPHCKIDDNNINPTTNKKVER